MVKSLINLFEKSIEIIQREGIRVFLKKFLAFAKENTKSKIAFLFFPYIILKIKKFHWKDVDELVNFAFSKNFGIVRPFQIPEEISQLLKILKEKKLKTILEIGTANGGTLCLFSCIASKNATIISIDLPGGKFGGGYPKWKIPLYKSFAKKNQKIYLIRADSHNQATLEKIKNILNGKKVNFLFIDGDHTYDGVKKDFEMYLPLIKERGIIALHDIVYGPYQNVGGVPNFWNEIKRNFNYEEIVKDQNQGGWGIGIIYLKQNSKNDPKSFDNFDNNY